MIVEMVMMSFLDLYTSPALRFAGTECELKDAEYVVIGVPLDLTSSYRPGSRFAPHAIRESSLNIEGFSFRTKRSISDLKIHDAGDLHIDADVEETLRRLELLTREILTEGKTPVLIGGEHTLTLGSARGVEKEFAVLCFDAHLDLRDEYMGRRVSHATVMRRVHEIKGLRRIVMVGTRAACRDEIEYAKKLGVNFISSMEISREGIEEIALRINDLIEDENAVYLSLDMDVLDPAFAPAVQTPEPDGISTHQLLEIISRINLKAVIAFDLVEVTPQYDAGVTATVAAKTIFEVLSHLR